MPKEPENAAHAEQDTPRKLAGELIQSDGKLDVRSPAFEANGRIPLRYSAYGEDVSPLISWSKGPEGTQSYVVLMEDPDAKTPKPFVHWILFNVPADVTSLREGMPGSAAVPEPKGAKQGTNSRGSVGYFGPRPAC
jgi:Raf kinase inhibitor-like YbhB/YbcL family protein